MKCVLSADSVRVFGKAVHALAGFGTELYMEESGDGLSLKTVNSSRSCYGMIEFARGFFQDYVSSVTSVDDTTLTRMTCKVSMKSALTIFKHLIILERTVDRCAITFDPDDDTKVLLEIYCQHDILKSYELFCMESEKLGAIYRKGECSNFISGSYRLLMEAVKLMRSNDSDITLGATMDALKFTNYTDDESDPAQRFYSELTLEKDEFHSFDIKKEISVTFSLKELKAALSFAEVDQWPVSIYFSGPGRPIIFTTEFQPTIKADFVFATMGAVKTSDNEASRTATQKTTTRPKPAAGVQGHGSVTVDTVPSREGASTSGISAAHISLSTPLAVPLPNEENFDSIEASVWDDDDWPEDVYHIAEKSPVAQRNQTVEVATTNVVTERQISVNKTNSSHPVPNPEISSSNPSKRFKSILSRASTLQVPLEDSRVLASDTDIDDDDSD